MKHLINTYIQEQKSIVILRSLTERKIIEAAKIIIETGFKLVEVSFASPNADRIINTLAKHHNLNEVIIGAGTVIDIDTAHKAYESGAQFFVAPNTDHDVIQFAQQKNIFIISGALTPTEIVSTHKLNVDMIKIFPIEPVGGIKYIQSIKEPLQQVRIFASGGITLENVQQYINTGVEAVGIANSLACKTLIESENYNEIALRAQKFLTLLR